MVEEGEPLGEPGSVVEEGEPLGEPGPVVKEGEPLGEPVSKPPDVGTAVPGGWATILDGWTHQH